MTRQSTLLALHKAYLAVKHGRTARAGQNRKMSVQAVADEAGVTAALIYNRYPEILALIRESKPVQKTSTEAAKADVTESTKQLRADIAKLASINARLTHELQDALARLAEADEKCEQISRELQRERMDKAVAQGTIVRFKPRN